MAKIKLQLKDKKRIAWDPDTDITWTGNKINESEITPFVAKAMAKEVLVEVKEKKEKEGKDSTEDKK